MQRFQPPVARDPRAILRNVVALLGTLALLAVLIRIARPAELWARVEAADGRWLLLGVAFEVLAFAGYITLMRGLFARDVPRMTWGASFDITLAGVAATRLFATAGAGGIALTSWALHAAGLSPRRTARAIAAFLVLLYASYVATLTLVSLLLLSGILTGAPASVAAFGFLVGAGVVVLVLAALLVPGDLERRARALAEGRGRFARLGSRLTAAPAIVGEAVAIAARRVRERPVLLAWSLLWWVGDVALLVVTFAAFGDVPALGVVVFAYFLGHVANAFPVPSGLVGTVGGMIGVLAACGVELSLAVIVTLTYQAISVWLPVLPGVAAFLSLQRRVRTWHAEDAAGQAA